MLPVRGSGVINRYEQLICECNATNGKLKSNKGFSTEALLLGIICILRPRLAVGIFPSQPKLKLLSTTNHTIYQQNRSIGTA